VDGGAGTIGHHPVEDPQMANLVLPLGLLTAIIAYEQDKSGLVKWAAQIRREDRIIDEMEGAVDVRHSHHSEANAVGGAVSEMVAKKYGADSHH
jgi:hypothetical protein